MLLLITCCQARGAKLLLLSCCTGFCDLWTHRSSCGYHHLRGKWQQRRPCCGVHWLPRCVSGCGPWFLYSYGWCGCSSGCSAGECWWATNLWAWPCQRIFKNGGPGFWKCTQGSREKIFHWRCREMGKRRLGIPGKTWFTGRAFKVSLEDFGWFWHFFACQHLLFPSTSWHCAYWQVDAGRSRSVGSGWNWRKWNQHWRAVQVLQKLLYSWLMIMMKPFLWHFFATRWAFDE